MITFFAFVVTVAITYLLIDMINVRRRLSHLEANALQRATPPEIQVSHQGEASSSSEVIPGFVAEHEFLEEEATHPSSEEREWDVERRAGNLLKQREDI